jgi:type II secretory pathway predicted ATPase ExeA
MRSSREGLQPEDVFTPTELPLADTNVYASRQEPERALDRAVRRGRVPVVFGEFGVGKTTLVRRFFREEDYEDRLVYIPSVDGRELSDLFRVVLEKLDYTVELERTQRASGGLNLSVVAVEAGAESTRRIVVDSPTDERIIDIMNERGVVLVVDEMHKATDSLRQDLASFVKAARGRAGAEPPIVLIGTTLDAEQLVRHDPGIDRFVSELMVAPLTDEESHFIVSEGFQNLGILIAPELAEMVVRTAAGAPTIVQTVCLDMADFALDEGRREVTEEDYRSAIRRYLTEHGRRLAALYMRSIEHQGTRRYRKQILRALSGMPQDFATMEDIRARVSEQLGVDVPPTALSGPLRALKEGDEPVLQDVERTGGQRVYNLTAFRDPMMKSFIRFMDEVEAQGLLPERSSWE